MMNTFFVLARGNRGFIFLQLEHDADYNCWDVTYPADALLDLQKIHVPEVEIKDLPSELRQHQGFKELSDDVRIVFKIDE